jgi:hypothetical protein
VITDWNDVPLSVGLKQTADILGVSVRWIEAQLAAGTMVPAPMPRTGRAWKWSKAKLRAHVDGPAYVLPRKGRAA